MSPRTTAMITLYRSGKTLQEIGDLYRLTRERVRQILFKNGVSRTDGGQYVQSQRRSQSVRALRDAESFRRWGCSYDEYLAIPATARRAFTQQKKSSRNRGIRFGLLLAQWWMVWTESGKWNLRGRTSGNFCMTRINDAGGYDAGNVQIMTIQDNSRLYALSKIGKKMRPAAERGVCLLYPGLNRPYAAYVKNKRIGYFRTSEEAYAARAAHMKSAA